MNSNTLLYFPRTCFNHRINLFVITPLFIIGLTIIGLKIAKNSLHLIKISPITFIKYFAFILFYDIIYDKLNK